VPWRRVRGVEKDGRRPWLGAGLARGPAVARLWLAAGRPTACGRTSNRLDVLDRKDDVRDEEG
jgi:hypothetical protein